MNNSTQYATAGIIPAAGYANRISPLPCSKEIYPIGSGLNENVGKLNLNVVSSSLLHHIRDAGTSEVYFIIRREKWDIPRYLGTGKTYGLNIAYLITEPTAGTPFTVNRAFPFLKNKYILFGFPDIIIKTANPFGKMLDRLQRTKSDVVLGLFDTKQHNKVDMVSISSNGLVSSIMIKPQKTKLTHTWLLAVWSPQFSDFFQDHILGLEENITNTEKKTGIVPDREIFMGDILQESIDQGFRVDSVQFSGADFLDIGTPEDLNKVMG